jgi:hypothetical protein
VFQALMDALIAEAASRGEVGLELVSGRSSCHERASGEVALTMSADTELMDEFVRKHFIQPELDSNDMSCLGPRLSFVTVLNRGGQEQARAGGPGQPEQ